MKIAALVSLLLLTALPARAENLVAGLSQDSIQITSSYSGTDIVVFGAIENGSVPKGRDVVVVIRGPMTDFTTRMKRRVAGVWINSNRMVVKGLPSYYYLAATKPIDLIASQDTLDKYDIGLQHLEPADANAPAPKKLAPYRDAIVRAQGRGGLYVERPDGVQFLGNQLFRVRVPVPASVPRGQYEADVYLFRDGAMISTQASPLFVEQAGMERAIFNFAHDWPLAYGVSAVVMSLLLGWLSSVVFRQNR